MEAIDVGKAFYHRLANRDERQGDGSHNAVSFRDQYLGGLDNEAIWRSPISAFIVLDFSNVRKIGPSFANEAFGYFARYARPAEIRERIVIVNATRVQELIIDQELDAAYARR